RPPCPARRLQRVAPGPGDAAASSGVFLTDAAATAHASRTVPPLCPGPHLLGRRAGGRDLSRPPEPAGPWGLRSLAGGGPPSAAPAVGCSGALRHRRCPATRRVVATRFGRPGPARRRAACWRRARCLRSP